MTNAVHTNEIEQKQSKSDVWWPPNTVHTNEKEHMPDLIILCPTLFSSACAAICPT